jgi:nucleotide-binding universal stress UspA family protein
VAELEAHEGDVGGDSAFDPFAQHASFDPSGIATSTPTVPPDRSPRAGCWTPRRARKRPLVQTGAWTSTVRAEILAAMISTVAVGTDGTATASEAVKTAAEIARRFGARLVLLSAFQDTGGRPKKATSPEVQWATSPAARVQEILSRTSDELGREGVECTTLVDEGDPAEVLVRLAEECNADLLVIGNKGMRRRVLGSVPNSITHNAPCAVLVVKTT